MPFEVFPYTNFHELNLDWIVEEIKNVKDKTDNIDASVEDAAQYAESSREYAEAAQEAVQSLQGLPHRMICIGDSYGFGYTPDGHVEGWPIKLKRFLNIADGDFYSNCIGSAGFCGTNDQGVNFLTLISTLSGTVTSPETITDIIVAGGYNDQSFTSDDIQNAIRVFLNYCKTIYPIAKVHIGCIAFTFATNYPTNYNIYGKLNTVLTAYQMTPFIANNGRYMNNIEFSLVNKVYMSSDLIHPNNLGEGFIAMYMAQYIKTGTCDVVHRQTGNLLYSSGITASGDSPVTTIVHNNITTVYMNGQYFNCNLAYSSGAITVEIGSLNTSTCINGTEYSYASIPINGFIAKNTGTPYCYFRGYAYISKGKLFFRFPLLNDDNTGFYSGNITAISLATPIHMTISTYQQY